MRKAADGDLSCGGEGNLILHDAVKGDHRRAEMLIGVSEAATNNGTVQTLARAVN